MKKGSCEAKLILLGNSLLDEAKNLFIAALNADEVAVDFLIAKGASKNKALVLAAHHGKEAAVDFLIAKGAVDKVQEEAASILLSINKNKDASLEDEQEKSSSQGGDNPDGGSDGIKSLDSSKKRSFVAEDEEDGIIATSSKAKKIAKDNPSSSANKDEGSKQNSLEINGEEVNSNGERSDVVQLRVRLDGAKIILSRAEQDLVDAEQELLNMI